MADTGPGIEALDELAADIAANLKTFTKKAWRMERKDSPHGDHQWILTEAGTTRVRKIWLRRTYHGGPRRFVIDGLLPATRHTPYSHTARASITVSVERGGRAIAGDISRRLLADYDQLLDQNLERIARQRAEEETGRIHYQALARVLPEEPTERYGGTPLGGVLREGTYYTIPRGGFFYGTHGVHGGIRAELNMSFEQLLRVLALLEASGPGP